MTTTDTPRTDACNNSLGVVPADFARELERELSEARALCAAQHKAIERLEQESKPEYWIEKGLSYCERAEKAEAEVERLRSQLKRSIEITEESWELEGYADKDIKAELDQIKEKIK